MTRTIVKSLVFTLVTVLATLVLAATIRNGSGGGTQYRALFTDATSLNENDDVRLYGVKVGSVTKVKVRRGLAEVTFTVSDAVRLRVGSGAKLQFRNMVGQRMLTLDPGEIEQPALPAGYTFPVGQTTPALDLTLLFNGFQPLFRMLSPTDVNNLSAQVIAVFQGEDSTVEGLLSSTASLTSTLASRDRVIGELISNLSSVLKTVNDRSGELDDTVVTMQRLVSGLAEDRAAIGSGLEGLGSMTTAVADLLEKGRSPLKESISGLGQLSTNLANAQPTLDHFFKTLPTKLDRIGRIASYGSWFNFYVCSIDGRIPMPEGYFGGLGVNPVAGRCR